MKDLLRETFIVAQINALTNNRFMPYAEDRPDFVLPDEYKPGGSRRGNFSRIQPALTPEGAKASQESDRGEKTEGEGEKPADTSPPRSDSEGSSTGAGELERQKTKLPDDLYYVDWYGPDDPEWPLNWSHGKKYLVTLQVCVLTFSVYIGSAIFTPGIPEIMTQFNSSLVVVELGLTFFVFAYGIGPLILSPLSEDLRLGLRIYIVTLLLFVLLQIPTALAPNTATLLAMRFLAGIFASPALATGGATLQDIYPPWKVPYAISIWACGAVGGPVAGPLVGAAMVLAEDWRWTFWLLMMISGTTFAFLLFLFPETSTPHLLHKRAQRLRRLTGRTDIVTKEEVEMSLVSRKVLLRELLLRPLLMTFSEPIVLFLDLHIALAYILLYTFFESFTIAYNEVYQLSLILSNTTYLGLIVGLLMVIVFFWFAIYKGIEPAIKEGIRTGKPSPPELSLMLAFPAAFFIPISMLWFGWTVQANVSIWSSLGATALWTIGVFLLFQSALGYLTQAYPRYAASVLASNDLFRSTLGSVFPLFAIDMFRNLGPSYAPVAWGCTILGVIGVLMIPIPFVLFKFGHLLRGRSRYAD